MAYDFIVIGSGIAGLYTAILASEIGKVLILTKGSMEECNTKYAQGGIAAPIGKGDSPELHFQDTIAVGGGLCDEEAVRIMVEEAADRIADLIKFGVVFDTIEGEIALARESAHSLPRILHAGGDATGEHIETTLSRICRSRADIDIYEHRLATEILIEKGKACGVKAFNLITWKEEEYEGKFVVLATGGAGQLFKYTTNTAVATGDGVAIGYKAGAEIMDIEFFQFHPTALRLPGAPLFLITEAIRGEGGKLINKYGEAFMRNYSPDGDLAPRDIVARSIIAEMERTNSKEVYLDVRHLPPQKLIARFPRVYNFCLRHNLDITKSPIPVAPAAHYLIGGVRTNIWGETNIPGLFASGETACTGVHGANRLASNSLLEVLVFAKRIIQRVRAGEISKPTPSEYRSLPQRKTLPLPPPNLSQLQELMWEKVGIIRSRDSLEEAATILASWEEALSSITDPKFIELKNMVLVGRIMAEAALLREESRGVHFRSDFPFPSPAWQRHIIFKKDA